MEYIIFLGLALYAYVYFSKAMKKGQRKVNKISKAFGISTSSKKSTTTFTPKTENEINNEAEQMAQKVKTLSGIEALEARLEKQEEKYRDEEDEIKNAKIEENIEILQMAIDMASDQPYRYYYFDEPDTDTELEELKLIGKLLTHKRYDELDNTLQGRFDFVSIGEMEDAQDMASEYLTDEVKELIKFRKIVESDLSTEEKAKKFNNLVSKSDYLLEELDLDDKPEPGEYDNKFEASLYGQYLQRFER